METHTPVPKASRKPGPVKEWIVRAYQKPVARGTGNARPRACGSRADLPVSHPDQSVPACAFLFTEGLRLLTFSGVAKHTAEG